MGEELANSRAPSTAISGASPPPLSKKKVIIDTDPGVDDAVAILMAFQSPALEVLGLTTTFGNVRTTLATHNALHLVELAGMEKLVPVAQGELTSISGAAKERIADFVHGQDGLGNTLPKTPTLPPSEKSGVQFLIDAVTENPQEITVIALGPLTNIAKAVQLDPDFPGKVKEIIILGGAFFVNGNVNPAAEANVFGDPEAADVVFGCGANITVLGIDVTQQVMMTGEEGKDLTASVKPRKGMKAIPSPNPPPGLAGRFAEQQLEELRDSPGPYGKYLHAACQFYLDYHRRVCGINGVYLHDPSTVALAVDPSLFMVKEGPVRVETQEGPFRGLTVASLTGKRWAHVTAWCNRPHVKVAVKVDSDKVLQLVMDTLMAPSKTHV